MNSSLAIYIGTTGIYWSSIVIVLGAIAAFCLAFSIYSAHFNSSSAVFVCFALTVVLGIIISRGIHFYCHQEQYDGFFAALTNFSGGSFFLPGVILAAMLAALFTKLLGIPAQPYDLLDAFAPALALFFAVVRLSAVFTTACRSKISITDRSLQHLPVGSAVTTASGAVEYRFATFFVTFILMLIAALVLLRFYYKNHTARFKHGVPESGHVFRMFIVLAGMIEIVMDSTRNDSTFPYFSIIQTLNRFASFISLTQLFYAIAILIIFIWYIKQARRTEAPVVKIVFLIVLYVISLAGVGVSEYLVQRHGDMYKLYYSTMSVCAVLMALSVILLSDL